MSDARPIGFFDSGLGGLTVLRAIRKRFPGENLLYLGDTARLPYGTKSPDTIRRYTAQNVRSLLSQNVKAIVIACNSASTALLAEKKSSSNPFDAGIPIYNVIEPGADAALARSASKRIGVLGTRATVGSKAYVHAIRERESQSEIFQIPAPLLVPLVEEGWETDPLTNLIVYRYVAPLMAQKIDTLILGCTHYPALYDSIQRVTGNAVELVDSANAIADLLDVDLRSGRIESSGSTNGSLTLLATDVSPIMNSTAKRLMADPELLDFKAYDIV